MTTAATKTRNANPVNGILNRFAVCGSWPVMTREGIRPWAINMVSAKVTINGT